MTDLKDKEYESLRSEILQWQSREITVFNISLTVIVAYVGWLLSIDSEKIGLSTNFSWQLASLFPMLLIGISINMQRIFEFFMMKISTYLNVFHESNWEKDNREISVEKEFLHIGLNNSYALIYLLLGLFSIIILYYKFPNKLFTIESIPFAVSLAFLITMAILLYTLRFDKKKGILIEKWEKVKLKSNKQHGNS